MRKPASPSPNSFFVPRFFEQSTQIDFAKLESSSELTEGDHQFRYWSHIQFLLHAETYFHHHSLRLIPAAHWRPYARYFAKYVKSPDFKEIWDDIGPNFSEDFAHWINAMLAKPPPNQATQRTAR